MGFIRCGCWQEQWWYKFITTSLTLTFIATFSDTEVHLNIVWGLEPFFCRTAKCAPISHMLEHLQALYFSSFILWHTGLRTLGMVGWGGGGGGCIHKSCSRMDIKLIFYCLETPKFVVTTNWLQLSTSTI